MGANFLAPQFWDSKKVAALGGVGKALWACMITGPQLSKVPGLYRGSQETFYKFMRPWSRDEVDSAFKAILVAGFAQFDADDDVIRLPKVWKYHPPQNSNQILSWRRAWVDFPNIDLKFQHLESLRLLANRSDSGPKAFDAYFGGIRQGYPETYPFDRSWVHEAKGGNHYPKGSGNGTANHSPAAVSDTKKDFVIYGREEISERDPDPDQNTDPDPDPRLPQGPSNGSGTVSETVPVMVNGRITKDGSYERASERPTGQRVRERTRSSAAATNGHSVDVGKDPPVNDGAVPGRGPEGGGSEEVDEPLAQRLARMGFVTD